jgi:hypothetical protein
MFVFCALSEQNIFFAKCVVTVIVYQNILKEFLVFVLEEEGPNEVTSTSYFSNDVTDL